jgi:hypothetical protein
MVILGEQATKNHSQLQADHTCSFETKDEKHLGEHSELNNSRSEPYKFTKKKCLCM